MSAIKFLINAYEASGKTTLSSQIKDALILNLDEKPYGIKGIKAIATLKDYTGMEDFIKFVSDKITAYKEKFGNFPKFIVFDTITRLYYSMLTFNQKKYQGFTTHSKNLEEPQTLNKYINDVLLANGVSVILVAHTQLDKETNRTVIPAQGQFEKVGSWHSLVNEAIFIEKQGGKRKVFIKSEKYPARTTNTEYLNEKEVSFNMEEFDINDYLNKLLEEQSSSEEAEL